VRVDLFDRAQLQAQASFSRFAEQQHPVGGRNMCSSSDPVAHAGLGMCNMREHTGVPLTEYVFPSWFKVVLRLLCLFIC
jgi:hypothetical protein